MSVLRGRNETVTLDGEPVTSGGILLPADVADDAAALFGWKRATLTVAWEHAREDDPDLIRVGFAYQRARDLRAERDTRHSARAAAHARHRRRARLAPRGP